MLSLKPAAVEATPCKLCHQPSALFGLVDINRNCQIPNGVKLPLSDTPIYYRRCSVCGPLTQAAKSVSQALMSDR
jgi:2-polyprenyl-6-hydroxyphenyl methylase/3-demethylubiquinone-9 3-methyltransferase